MKTKPKIDDDPSSLDSTVDAEEPGLDHDDEPVLVFATTNDSGTEDPDEDLDDEEEQTGSQDAEILFEVTGGKVLPDGAILEVVAGDMLLLFKQECLQIGACIDYRNVRYSPSDFRKGPAKFIALPDWPQEFGSLADLVDELVTAVCEHSPLDRDQAFLAVTFTLATWVSDFLPAPPVLNVIGHPAIAFELRSLLHGLCRRSLNVVDSSLRQLLALQEGLAPTVFVSTTSAKSLDRLGPIWNGQGMLYGEDWLQVSSPVAAFTAKPLRIPALRVQLPANATPYRRPTAAQWEVLKPLQRKLLQYRVERHQQVAASGFDATAFAPDSRAIARVLGSCFEGEPGLQSRLLKVLEPQDELAKASLSQQPQTAVLEALLTLIHESRAEALVSEVAERANAILFSRRSARDLSVLEVGDMIRDDLGLFPRRVSKGMALALGRNTCSAIHQVAQSRGAVSLLKIRESCEYCRNLSQPQADLARKADAEPNTSATLSTQSTLSTSSTSVDLPVDVTNTQVSTESNQENEVHAE